MRTIQRAAIFVGGALAATLSGCKVPGFAAESAFPTVMCESGGERRVRVYGHGFVEGVLIQATFAGEPATVTRVDDYTLDVWLPDVSLNAASYPWDPHDFYTGELGLYADVDGALEPVQWNVLIPRSKLSASGAPDFKNMEGGDIYFRNITVSAIVEGYDEAGAPIATEGPFNFGYFTSGERRYSEDGSEIPGCEDDTDDYPGQFCYVPSYYTAGGQPLLYDASDFAYYWYYAPWDPYMYKGSLALETADDTLLYYYDGRANETDYAPGEVFNQSFGVFFSLSPSFVYTDDETGEVVESQTPLSGSDDDGLTFVGMDVGSLHDEFFPSILPLSRDAALEFRLGNGEETYSLQSPIGLVSKDFDYSLWYTDHPYYNFTEYHGVDLDGDGTEDEYIPTDGSWGCVWLSQ